MDYPQNSNETNPLKQVNTSRDQEIVALRRQLQYTQSEADRLTQQVKVQCDTIKTIHATCTSLRVKLEAQQEAHRKLQDQLKAVQMKDKISPTSNTDRSQQV